jgi:hypothetical protein
VPHFIQNYLPIFSLSNVPLKKINIFNHYESLSYLAEMPIFKTSGNLMGELRFLAVST